MILFLLMMMASCAVAPPVLYPRSDLVKQRLVFRLGDPGPSNQICTKYDPTAKCILWDKVAYDLTDKDVRSRLRDNEIFCNVSGKRFRACVDKPGICSTETVVTGRFLGIPVKHEVHETNDFIELPSGSQRLVDAAAWCASLNSPLGQSMFQKQ